MSPRQEDKKEPVLGNGNGSSDEQEMEAVDDELMEGEGELDLQGKQDEHLIWSYFSRPETIAEIAALNENIDNLNSVLDTIEQRADDMREKVMALLLSNREIRKALQEENKAAESGNSADGDGGKCNHHPGKPADEA